MVVSTGEKQKNPFPGLRPFREDEERYFFGREHQVDTMVNKLAATRFLAVVGTSGSGKSSLVNCGLRPGLHRGLMAKGASAWRMAQFRPGSNPIRSLAEALAAKDVLFPGSSEGVPREEIVETYLQQSAKGIVEAFRKARLPEGTNLLVVADQFEELFRYQKLESADAQKSVIQENAIAFVNLLLAAATEPDSPIYVVITMRSDFLGDCAQFYGLPEAINRAQYLVPRMTRDERRASIAGPIGVGEAEITPVLLTRLVNDVGDNPDQLSILQHALHRTWEYWESQGREGPLDLAHYTKIGTMTEALNEHANEAFQLLKTPQSIEACEKLFKALTDLGTDARGIRRPLKLASLTEIAAPNGDSEEIKSIIEVFRDPSRAFLMPPVPEPLEPKTVIDISHESLMRVWERLRTWAKEEAESARQYRRLSDTAAREKDQKAQLWRDPDLQVALDWKEEGAPTKAWADLYGGDFESSMGFLERSRAERNRELAEVIFSRRWRYIKMIVVWVIVVIFVWRFTAGDLEYWEGNFSYKKPTPAAATNGTAQEKLEEVSAAFWTPNTLNLLLALTFFLGWYFLGYFALTYFGKWLFRTFVFAKILDEVALSSTKAAREQKLVEEAEGDAVIKLQTTYASFWRRWGAYVLDLALFMAVALLFYIGCFFLLGFLAQLPEATIVYVIISLLLLPFVLDWLYHGLMISSRRQATLGMRALGIYTTDRKGNRLHFGRASARHLAKLLSYLTLGIGFFIQPFTEKHQTLHDRISRTVVLVNPGAKNVPWWMVAICVVVGLLVAMPFAFFLLSRFF